MLVQSSPIGGPIWPADPTGEGISPPQAAKNSAAIRVLIVDDESLVRWSVRETLARCGYEMAEAVDGASAIEACSGTTRVADVVLLDLQLPDSDDLRVLSAIRLLSPPTRVVLMTAFGSPELADQARQLGAFAVLGKPFDMNELAPLIECALAGDNTPLRSRI